MTFNNIITTNLHHIKSISNMPADTTKNTATATATINSGLDILFAAIDYQQSSNETSSSFAPTTASSILSGPTVSPNPNPPETASINPFRSKMDPRMKKSIQARASNHNMLDEEAVLVGFAFPERGTKADVKWIGEDLISMRQRKINFRRSWKRFHSRQKGSVTVIPSSPIKVHATVSSSDEDSSSTGFAPTSALDDHFRIDDGSMALPKKRLVGSSICSTSWLPSGEAFELHKREEFESQILPKLFPHGTSTNSGLFPPRLVNDCGSIIFCHDDFKRDDPDRMNKISLQKNNTFEFLKVSKMDASCAKKNAMRNKAVATSSPAMTTLLPSISISPGDVVTPHGLAVTCSPDLIMMQRHRAEMSRLIFQRQQHLNYMSQKTKYSRALLHGMME